MDSLSQMMMMQQMQQNQNKMKIKPSKPWNEKTFFEKCHHVFDTTIDKIKEKTYIFIPFILIICVRGVWKSFINCQDKGLLDSNAPIKLLVASQVAQGLLPLPLSR